MFLKKHVHTTVKHEVFEKQLYCTSNHWIRSKHCKNHRIQRLLLASTVKNTVLKQVCAKSAHAQLRDNSSGAVSFEGVRAPVAHWNPYS